MSSRTTLLEKVVHEAAQDLAAAYGLDVPCTSEEDDEQLAAIIGFTSPGYRGSLVVSVSKRTLEQVRAPGTTATLNDWTAELSNQLLGRVKNRLLLHGPAINIALPVSIAGNALRIGVVEDPRAFRGELKAGALHVRVNVLFDLGFEFTPSQGEAPAEPGDLVLF
jgi:CheY-specific phosphatase CheX